ncbi:ankyrin repeat domain-containing protein [Tahibacter soli]|jgi:ankyrin repeat protein|uniref:Ankyrin repeat domain-containing protein n=1 Tax=Tahibacter soli TaxID=2983605 RepID=A0A9X3YPA4_9GAMM|nr:ankyrin repeat domain-containing protein [Tahibacter soli]MDC8014960.1 ankyrin repeat domain-containing protein [Tahibacter soli]
MRKFLSLSIVVACAACSNPQEDAARVVYEGDPVEVAKLIKKGTPANLRVYGKPLIVIAFEGRGENWKDTASILLDNGADINAGSESGDNALLVSAMWAHEEAVEYLLSRGADAAVRSHDGKNALLLLGFDGEQEKLLRIAKLLVEKGADPCSSEQNGTTPAKHAREMGMSLAAEYLAQLCSN